MNSSRTRRRAAAAIVALAIAAAALLHSCGGDRKPAPTAQAGGSAAAEAGGAQAAGAVPEAGAAAGSSAGSPAGGSPAAGAAPAQEGEAQGTPQAGIGSTQAAQGSAPSGPPSSAQAASAQAAPGAAPPADPAKRRAIGELAFAEGTVTIHRAGAEKERADIGSVVRAFDVIVTGAKSRAEIDLGSGTAGGATVKLAENTAFYFDTKELDQAARRTVIQLLSGAVAVKVDTLANGSFRIATDQAVLGVRGTVFIVDTAPDGSMLVTCDSGAVGVTADGTTRTAKPGGAVEQPAGGELRLLAVDPADLAKYRGGWRADAYKAFAGKALAQASAYASALDSGKRAFDSAYAGLAAQAAILDSWRAARASGRTPRFTDWIAEKKAVSAALFECLKAMFKVERPYYRLLELKALHASGVGSGALKDGRTSSAFYSGFDAAYGELATKMAKVREALMLFQWASAGSPLGELFGAKAGDLGSGSAFLEE